MKFGTELNSKEDDFSPSIGNDGQVLIFDSKSEKGDTDIYICAYTNGGWTTPKPFYWLNTEFNEETPFISNDSNVILFASDRKDSLTGYNPRNVNVHLTYDIFISYYIDNAWQKPRRLRGDINTILNERCPSLSKDRMTIYFSRWEFENIQHAKIMQATLNDYTTEGNKPLPAIINSGHGDIAFRQSDNLDGFFFSSLRPGGFGGWDLYFISYKNSAWGTPVNLGPDLNTPWHEMFISRSGDMYYFSSNRRGGIGYYDIYGIHSLNVAVNKEMYRARMEAHKNAPTAYPKPSYTKKFREESNPSQRNENRIAKNVYVETSAYEEPAQSDFPVVYFDYKSSKLQSKYKPQLNKIASYLKTNTHTNLKIIGHTDERGGNEFNCDLSYKRAKTVYNYLASKDIRKKRLKIISMGKTMPLQDRNGEYKSDSKNRRVEFSLIDN